MSNKRKKKTTLEEWKVKRYNKSSTLKVRDWLYKEAKTFGNHKYQLAYEY